MPRVRSLRSTAHRLLPPQPEVRALAVADLVGSIGWGAFVAGSAVFFTRSVGLSAAQVAIGLSVAGGLGFAVAVPGGRLVDRAGPRRVLVVAGSIGIAGYCSYALIDSFGCFLAVISVLGIVNRLDRIAIGALVGGLLAQDDRVKASAYLRSVSNLGFSAGAGLAGAALVIDTRPAYLALPIGTAVTGAAVILLRNRLPVVPPAPPHRAGDRRWVALRDRPFVALTALFGVARLDGAILDIGLPLWIIHHTTAPRPLVAWLVIVNTALVILLQVRAARGSDTLPGIVRAKRLASVAMIAACLVFGASGSLPQVAAILTLIAGMALLTVGELLISAAGWSVRYGLAREHAQGEYGAVFGLGTSAIDMVGPALVVLLTDRYGLTGWGALAAIYAGLFVAIRPVVAWAGSRVEARA